MRVLRTEMYFPKEQIVESYSLHTRHAENPGLGFAWFHTGGDTSGFDERLLATRQIFHGEVAVVTFLDHVLRGYEEHPPFPILLGMGRPPANLQSVLSAMDGDIIIEESPPQAITLRALLAKAPGVAIGTLVGMTAPGMAAPGDATMLMLLTVPGGIVVCSSASGVSKALEKGLNKMVERLMEEKEQLSAPSIMAAPTANAEKTPYSADARGFALSRWPSSARLLASRGHPWQSAAHG